MKPPRLLCAAVLFTALAVCPRAGFASESPFLYGIFSYDLSSLGPDDNPAEFLGVLTNRGVTGWITSTVLVGTNANHPPNFGIDFRPLADQGHAVICRLNNGYFPNGTIPLPGDYDDFASRCSNFVAHSPGCSVWTIGNELNISGEWPYDPNQGKCPYVTPASYAACYRKVYNAIKAIHPTDRVLPAAPACYSGPFSAGSNPYGPNNYPYDALPLNWVQHLNQLLMAIAATGPLDGVAVHLASRGYTCEDIHSTGTLSANGQNLSSSFLVYRDWVNYGIPASLRSLPVYATECNGYYWWKGGDPSAPSGSEHYFNGWVQEIYSEINRYNQYAFSTNGPVFRCVNLYRWSDPNNYNIAGDDPYKDTILSDLDQAAAQQYFWPSNNACLLAPIGLNFLDPVNGPNDTILSCNSGTYGSGGVVPQSDWLNLTQGGTGTSVGCGGGVLVSWSSPGGTHHNANVGWNGGNLSLMSGYLDDSDSSTKTVTFSGLKFPLYDILAYSDGDNGSATRVNKLTLTGTGITTLSKYVRDDANVNFSGTFTEADSTTGGASAPSGNYVRFHNLRASAFTLTSKGDYASDGHPRGPLNALQIVPINVIPVLLNPSYAAGQFQCLLLGATNMNYVLQGSTNLIAWTPVLTNVAPALIAAPAPQPYRFFRAVFQ